MDGLATDILLWVETFDNGGWQFANPWRVERSGPSATERIVWERPYDERNYVLFGLLADVRNRDQLQTPLDRPRGLPSDISDVARRIVAFWEDGIGVNDASWFSAEELLSHDWNALTRTFDPEAAGLGIFRVVTQPERLLCSEFVESFVPTLATYGPAHLVRVCFFFA